MKIRITIEVNEDEAVDVDASSPVGFQAYEPEYDEEEVPDEMPMDPPFEARGDHA